MEQEFEREPSPEELAEELQMDVEDVSEAMSLSSKHLSMDAPFSNNEENRLLDVLENPDEPSPDDTLMNESFKEEIGRALSKLSAREAEVIKLYFGIDIDEPLTLEEIGEKFNLTRERVRQIKEKAIRRLRNTTRSKELKKYLG
ncbi:MAG: sigma-70 family RNA polymerase sigma factor [Ignavibacteriaceae bacterium]|nr:sigma-70 family RNA polymerase sigma factor [Ignavibacteriaceae bacterium]